MTEQSNTIPQSHEQMYKISSENGNIISKN